MNDKYFFRNKRLLFFIKTIDYIGAKIFKSRKIEDGFKPKKIIISNIGHLGDVLLSLPLIESIKKSNKEIQIFYLCLESSMELLKNNPNIEKIVTYYSFFQSSEKNFFKKLINSILSFLKTIFIIRKIKPDIAFDLRASFPNTLLLLSLGGVKKIIGYGTVGFGFVLSQKIEWDDNKHEIDHYKDVLKVFFDLEPSKLELNLGYLCKGINANLLFTKFEIKDYKKKLVFHIVSRDERKMIDIEKWKEVYKYCNDKYEIIFTGNKEEAQYIQRNFSNYKNLKNLAGKLSLGELITLLRNVNFIITIDSFVAQICSIYNLPSIIIFTGGVDVKRFGPIGDRCIILKGDISCSPCGWYLRDGCKYECKDLSIIKKFIEMENKI
jgi:heptosyltransferase-2